MSKGRGNPNANIFFVGEAYGQNEEKLGKPFVGPAGNTLTECLLKAGIDPDDCYFSNLVNARPPSNDLSAWIPKGVPNERVLDGMESLAEEIEAVNPNVIVPLGNWPLWAFYKPEPTGISSYRGYVLEAKRLAKGRKLVPTFHPSYLQRGNWAEIPLTVFDLSRARQQSSFPEVVRKPRRAIIDPRGHDRDVVRERLLTEGRWLSVDIEYIGSRLLCVGFAVSSDWAATIRIRSPEDVVFCQQLIESGRPLLMQNAMFDCGILEWHYGMTAFKHLAYDTMVAAYELNIEYPKDLGWLAGMYTDLHPWWEEIDGKFWNGVRAGTQDIGKVLPYNCLDAMATYEIAEKQDPELDSHPKLREAFEFDMAKIEPLWDVARRGVLVDAGRLDSIRSTAIRDATEAQEALNEIADAVDFDRKGLDVNVKSGPQMITLLYGYLGINPTKKTKGEGWATDNKCLMEYMRISKDAVQKKAIEFVLRVREARDIQSKFTDIEWDTDGRARCIYDATKTTTRRLSSKKFFPTGKGTNLQNIPAPSSNRYGAEIRKGFIPDPGYEFAYADLKGAEFLVVAQLTQDPLMLKYAEMTMLGTGDVHKETGSYIFGIPPEKIGKESPERFLGKKMRHSGNYMIGPKELMGNINKEGMKTGVWIDQGMAKKMINGYVGMHPGLKLWWDEVAYEVRTTRKLSNLFGFIRRFNGNVNQILPVAVAFVPQSTIGDYLNYGLLACANDAGLAELGFQLLLQVHDAIGFQYPISNRAEVLARVRRLMDIGVRIPKTGKMLHIPVEIQCGPSWGEEKEYTEDLIKVA